MQKRKSETEEEFKERRRIYNAATRDPVRNRANAKAWAAANPERKRANNSAWKEANPEQWKQSRENWKEKNKDRICVYKQTRRAKASNSSGTLSPDIAARLMALQKCKCANCKCKLSAYHLDHIEPLALGGLNADMNVQLLCPACNLRKSSKHPIDFAQQEGRLL